MTGYGPVTPDDVDYPEDGPSPAEQLDSAEQGATPEEEEAAPIDHEPHHIQITARLWAHDSNWGGTHGPVEVRAWSLAEGLRAAAQLPLTAWVDGDAMSFFSLVPPAVTLPTHEEILIAIGNALWGEDRGHLTGAQINVIATDAVMRLLANQQPGEALPCGCRLPPAEPDHSERGRADLINREHCTEGHQ